MVGRVIEHVAHRIFRAAHDSFHSVNRAQIVASIDPFAASRAHQNILVVIRHPDHFMRHHLPDRENQIEPALQQKPVHLRRPRIVQLAFRLRMNKLRRNLANRLDIRSPVMNAK